ncbi:MAG: hypothetical protein HY293_11410 [Planctomycetes bacterium]|nr:hypothetical protein [Planctomycetota bacterium]
MKEYRQNSHTLTLVFWSILCAGAAAVLFIQSRQVVSRALKAEEILAGVAFLIFGPAALTAYLLRARHVWVSVDQIRGVVVSWRRVIPLEEIESIERRRPVFRRSTGPFQMPDTPGSDVLRGWGSAGGCLDLGCLGFAGEVAIGIMILIAAFYVLWLLFFVILPLLLLPLAEVFAPFGDRIRIKTRTGSLLLRDLREADEFLHAVALRRPITER